MARVAFDQWLDLDRALRSGQTSGQATHSHRCPCGNQWSHSGAFGDEKKHTCQRCGRVQFWQCRQAMAHVGADVAPANEVEALDVNATLLFEDVNERIRTLDDRALTFKLLPFHAQYGAFYARWRDWLTEVYRTPMERASIGGIVPGSEILKIIALVKGDPEFRPFVTEYNDFLNVWTSSLGQRTRAKKYRAGPSGFPGWVLPVAVGGVIAVGLLWAASPLLVALAAKKAAAAAL